MFRESEPVRQPSFFNSFQVLPVSLRQELQRSWATTFRAEVFDRIDETLFAGLYSDDQASRPNTAVNVLVSLEILKSGFGWSDQELLAQVRYNLQIRHAVGLDELGQELFTIRTVYNFRRRVREHAAQTGKNLLQKVFETVTDAQLEAIGIRTGWQRMDSTQVLSNLAAWSRLELLVAVAQVTYKALLAAERARWAERMAPYLIGRPQQVGYRIKPAATAEHLQRLGEWLVAWEELLQAADPESQALALVQRVLREQYVRQPAGTVTLRPGAEVPSDSLQSPHDPEATHRIKAGQSYRGGYVVNVSETADPRNPLQLITDVQVEPNVTDDTVLLAQSLADQAARGVNVEEVTVDGGYTGPLGEAACAAQQVKLRPTRLRGGHSGATQWGNEKYTWELDAAGQPERVTCPQGTPAALIAGRGTDTYLARFDAATCAACPYFGGQCRVQARKRWPPTLYVRQRAVTVARQRQALRPIDKPVRAVVEATVRSLKHAFPGSKLPVRGLIRARMLLYGAALLVNLRRWHHYQAAQAEKVSSTDSPPEKKGRERTPESLVAHFSRFHGWLASFLGVPRWAVVECGL